MEIKKILNNHKTTTIYGLIGNIDLTSTDNKYQIISDTPFPNTIKEYLSSPKDINALKMVMLSPEYLNKTAKELTENELKKVNFAKCLIENYSYLIFDYFEKGFIHQEKENFKRLFKKLTQEYDKTILIFTNDITFIWDIAETLFIVDNNKVINTIPKESYFDITDYVDKPEIIKFTNLMHQKNIKVSNYKNVLDLLKAIYRIKESK